MTSDYFIPFSMPDVGEAEIAAVSEAIRSGWLTSGPQVLAFEREFAEAVDVPHAVAVNSATSGLHLALEAIGVGPGDEVVVPAWTFTATAEVVRYLGGTPVLCDVDEETFNIDLADAARRLTDRTKALMPVHFAGLPIPHQELEAFGDRHGIAVVEDAAHAFPAGAPDRVVGSYATAATVFSFYANKTMTTGEGGMLVTHNDDLAARARVMRLHGISRDVFDRYRSRRPSWRCDVVAPGYKYNLSDPAAAMGRVQLRRAESMRERRQTIAERYSDAFADLPLRLPSGLSSGFTHAWHLYVVRLTEEAPARDAFIDALAEQGVSASVHFIPLHHHTYWRSQAGVRGADLPVSEAQAPLVASLPLFSAMSDDAIEQVIEAVRVAVNS